MESYKKIMDTKNDSNDIAEMNVKGFNTGILQRSSCGILASAITMVIIIFAMSYGQMLSGKYTFINGDLYTQCAPFAHLFIDKISGGGNLYYSFRSGIGMNISLILAFYDMSPFNLFYALSDGNNINDIAILIFILKAGCAAFSFWLYAGYNIKVKNATSIIFSIGYALVSYGLFISNMTALYDGIYLLPLILVAIKYMVDNKKALLLSMLYFFLFISNFYSGYIVGLASFVYFVVYVMEAKCRKVDLIECFFRYVFAVLGAVLLASFIVAPALSEALRQNAIDLDYDFHIVPIWDMISYLFPFHKSIYSEMTPFYYCGLPILLLIAAFFFNSGISRRHKVIAGAMLVFSMMTMSFKPLYSAAHMFNNPTGYTFRYVYIIALVLASLGLFAVKNMRTINVRYVLIVDVLILIVHIMAPIINKILGLYDNSPSIFYYTITIILFVVWIFLFFVYKELNQDNDETKFKKLRNVAILVVFFMAIELGLNSYVILTTIVRQYSDDYEYRVAQADALTSELKKLDDSVYRIHYDGLMNQNQSCVYDYYGVTLFASSGNQKLKDFLCNIGILCNDFSISDLGSTDLARLLLDEKYNLIAHVNYDESNSNYIEQNITAGFGFMVDEQLAYLQLDSNVFENQNKIYSCLLEEDIEPYTLFLGDLKLEGAGVNVQNGENGISFSLAEGESEGGIFIKLSSNDEKEMHSWLVGGTAGGAASPVIISPEDSSECGYMQHILNNPHIMKMTREDDNYVIYIALADGVANEGDIIDYSFAYYDDSFIQMLQEKLSKQSFCIETLEDGYVTGNITASEPGICFMSIPYEAGWSATIDGEPQEITPVFNEAFIGIPLDAGYHEIELRFEAPFSRIGCMLSAVGVIMLVTIGVTERISNNKRSKMQ